MKRKRGLVINEHRMNARRKVKGEFNSDVWVDNRQHCTATVDIWPLIRLKFLLGMLFAGKESFRFKTKRVFLSIPLQVLVCLIGYLGVFALETIDAALDLRHRSIR